MKINKLDIVTLSDNKEYVVSDDIIFNGIKYYLLVEVDNNEEIKENAKLLKEINTNNKILLQEETDEELFIEVVEAFENK